MGRKRSISVKKHLSMEELKQLLRDETDSRIKERLIFIRILYDGEKVEKAAREVGKVKATGYEWLHRWNEEGLEGLKPNFGGGRPPKLSYEKREELKEILEDRDDWTTREIRKLVKEKFGVEYSPSHLRRILKSLGMKCGKPYPSDYRRPENAEEILKKKMEEVLDDEEGCIVGFLDESNPQTTSSRQRTWSFDKPEIVKNTTYFRANTFGFYPLNGESVVEFKENSKKERVCEFFEEIREENPDERIVMILDNFRSHKAKVAREKAEELGIDPVFLPPYSPDLNPIEQIWRILKRKTSLKFAETREDFLDTIRETFNKLSKKLSFASGWMESFLSEKFRKLHI